MNVTAEFKFEHAARVAGKVIDPVPTKVCQFRFNGPSAEMPHPWANGSLGSPSKICANRNTPSTEKVLGNANVKLIVWLTTFASGTSTPAVFAGKPMNTRFSVVYAPEFTEYCTLPTFVVV